MQGGFEEGHGMLSRHRPAALGGPLISHIPSSPGMALSGPALFDPSLAQDSICHDTFVTVPSPNAVFQITQIYLNANSIPQTEQSCQNKPAASCSLPQKTFQVIK